MEVKMATTDKARGCSRPFPFASDSSMVKKTTEERRRKKAFEKKQAR